MNGSVVAKHRLFLILEEKSMLEEKEKRTFINIMASAKEDKVLV